MCPLLQEDWRNSGEMYFPLPLPNCCENFGSVYRCYDENVNSVWQVLLSLQDAIRYLNYEHAFRIVLVVAGYDKVACDYAKACT